MKEMFLNYEESINEEINKIDCLYDGKDETIKNFKILDEILIRINKVINNVLDLSTEFIEFKELGVYKKRINSFDILEKNNVIDKEVKKSLEALCGLKDTNMNNRDEIDANNVIYIINNKFKEVKDFLSNISKNI
ncbi:HepT-like ribonuclease domain-containing protein [Clostridium frigidicarnis]|uniref:DUF86 domain-containing protein n=1 Tax=Clostridium frigidicarnis TaxID=84698 RepID=A0A1I1B7A1_9CLOT|nr:HepT-like ribonuclease domain-containing protein [Clostridium frigidicarnis]SFB45662.1 Protein of unknown function DUF86 [Clostridium frigidicarnis]